MKALIIASCLALASCGVPITGKIFYADDSGAKGGLEFVEGGVDLFGRYVDKDGNLLSGNVTVVPRAIEESGK
jgi:hypothetical protein